MNCDFSKHTFRPMVDMCFIALPRECLYYITAPPFDLMNRPLYSELVPYYELIEGRDWQKEINLIKSILVDHHCKSSIDLGCGTGYHARALTRLGFEMTGIDISKQNIQFARRNARIEKVRP